MEISTLPYSVYMNIKKCFLDSYEVVPYTNTKKCFSYSREVVIIEV